MDNADRQRIHAEEIFREEVRKSLEKPKTRSKALLAFLNTGVGLWLLGTVAATGVSLAYAYFQETFKSRAERATREKKLILESHVRLLQWETQMVALRARGNDITPEDFTLLWSRLLAPPVGRDGGSTGIYSLHAEYDRRALVSILYELFQTVEDTASKADLSELGKTVEFFLEWDPLIDRRSTLDEYFAVLRSAKVNLEFRERTTRYSRYQRAPPAAPEFAIPPPPPPPISR